MSTVRSREVRLKSRPQGLPGRENFEFAEVDVPEPGAGQFLVRNIWMSVDPYMRGRMSDRRSYVPPFQIGAPLDGGCVGQVVASQHPAFPAGTYVLGVAGWREQWLSDGNGVTPIDPQLAPIQASLGVLGMPGMTAYVGLLKIAAFQAGETVVVSAAAGAVGSVACQIARIHGCRVVGSAGSDAKVAWLRDVAGVDHAFNYKQIDSYAAELARAAPEGFHVCYENVGGEHLEAALASMRDFGRIAVCGMIGQYNSEDPPPGPKTIGMVILRRLRMQGFIVTDHADLREPFFRDMSGWIKAGRIRWEETVVEGLDRAPEAFLGLFQGDNLGKMLVKIDPDPASAP